MESSKLKNIALTILLITNALLLGLTVVQQTHSRQYSQQALLDAVELLERQGIQVNVRDLPQGDFPAAQSLEADPDGELADFTALLGEGTALTQQGLVTLYSGPLGKAEVREDGAFSVVLEPGSYPMGSQELSAHALGVLKRMGFSAQVYEIRPGLLRAVQVLDGVPVFSCTAALRYEQGQLRAISGVRLLGRPAAAQESGALSTATLLIRFRAAIIHSGDACSAVRSATQGYTLSTDANHNLCLIPVLRLETDTNLYTFNAVTGEPTQE